MALLALPTAVYWNTIWSHFGFRDDYSILRETHQEAGKVVGFCASQARPLYGWMLESSMSRVQTIDQLPWLRLASALCIGLTSALVWVALVAVCGWRVRTAAFAAALLAVVPTAQVLTSWSICWPHSFAAAMGVGGFLLSEAAWSAPTTRRRLVLGGAAWTTLLACALIYQSNGLFFLVLWGAAFLSRLEQPLARLRGWTVHHAGILSTAYLAAYGFVQLGFRLDWFWRSDRVEFEPDLGGKWLWFAHEVLPNALALLALDDVEGRTRMSFDAAWMLSLAVLIVGGLLLGRRLGFGRMLLWFAAFLSLATATYGISLIASERWSTYRTIYPLVGVVIIFLVSALGEVSRWKPRAGASFCAGALVLLVSAGAALARYQAYHLIALPQRDELAVIESVAAQADATRPQRVFFIIPTLRDSPAPLVFADEFGSLSTDSDWAPGEMLKDVLQARSQGKADFGSRWEIACGRRAPDKAKAFDRFVDLRRIRDYTSERHAKL